MNDQIGVVIGGIVLLIELMTFIILRGLKEIEDER